jgi:protease I
MDFLNSSEVHSLFRLAMKKEKFVGAICIAPRILAEAGILKNKKATGWDGDNELGDILVKAGAEYIREPVVVDGTLITASGPAVARDWGLAIVQSVK